jgi:hypothetical protein
MTAAASPLGGCLPARMPVCRWRLCCSRGLPLAKPAPPLPDRRGLRLMAVARCTNTLCCTLCLNAVPARWAPLCRAALGLLPRMHLQLPGEAAGLLHPVCVLLEAVEGAAPPPPQAGAAAPAGGLAAQPPGGSDGQRQAARLRVTAFGAAGAVACWQEAEADGGVTLRLCAARRTPAWQPRWGPGAAASQLSTVLASHSWKACMALASSCTLLRLLVNVEAAVARPCLHSSLLSTARADQLFVTPLPPPPTPPSNTSTHGTSNPSPHTHTSPPPPHTKHPEPHPTTFYPRRPGGFSLVFPHPDCPQLDLFAGAPPGLHPQNDLRSNPAALQRG